MALKLTWFIPVDHRDFNRMPASVWIRCLQLHPYLEDLEVSSTVNDRESKAPVAVFVRWQDEEAYKLAKRCKSEGKKVVFDLCVNYFEESEVQHLGKPVSARHIEECLRMLSVANLVTCASDNITQTARKFHPWAEYLPDSIDKKHFKYTKNTVDFSRSVLTIIWSGQYTKAMEIEPILPLLKDRNFKLTIISNGQPSLHIPGLFWKNKFPYKFILWQYETFPKSILEGDICISHRPVDTLYNRGHSFFKIGVFMAQGVPALASPVPSYQELLEDQSSGKICSTIEDWAQILDRLYEDRNLLCEWSENASNVMKQYWTSRIVEDYVSLFNRLCT